MLWVGLNDTGKGRVVFAFVEAAKWFAFHLKCCCCIKHGQDWDASERARLCYLRLGGVWVDTGSETSIYWKRWYYTSGTWCCAVTRPPFVLDIFCYQCTFASNLFTKSNYFCFVFFFFSLSHLRWHGSNQPNHTPALCQGSLTKSSEYSAAIRMSKTLHG